MIASSAKNKNLAIPKRLTWFAVSGWWHSLFVMRNLQSTWLVILCLGVDLPTAKLLGSELLFAREVYPLLEQKCLPCHGDDPDDIQGGLDMRSRASMLAGGDTRQPSIVPGSADHSLLYQAVLWSQPELQMPPKENDRLTQAQTLAFKRWIDAGAPWADAQRRVEWIESHPEALEEETLRVSTSGGLSPSWDRRTYQKSSIWAFLPYEALRVPTEVGNKGHHPIDAFLQQKREANGLAPAPPAKPRELIRRMFLDLTGLLPQPEELGHWMQRWELAASPGQVIERLIEHLLASPHYGERWAQHWLDVVRYADTGGMSNDYERSNAWRYRDYVVRAFNEDKPYDQFLIEQLAGDELADQSLASRLGEDPSKLHAAKLAGNYSPQETQWLIASNFLRMGPWDNAMVQKAQARQIYLDDVVNATGQVFLGMTLRCVKCHDHKFDPIPTRDYYRLYAAFATTHLAERPAPFIDAENKQGFEADKAHVEAMLAYAQKEKGRLIEKRESAARDWYTSKGRSYLSLEKRRNLPDASKPPRGVGLNHTEQGQLKVREQDEWIWTRRLERYEPMVQSVFTAPDVRLAGNAARKLRLPVSIGQEPVKPHHILLGGDLNSEGEVVQPGVLSALGLPIVHGAGDQPHLIDAAVGGRRLALARWMADPNNPLVARALVNRIWQHHFGKPLAGNPNNLGASGSKPTHPALLDWLANKWVQEGWSIKQLHRWIMTSEAYQMSTHHPDRRSVEAIDPDNHSLSYFTPRKMTAEEIRDNILMISGELNLAIGGLPIRPEINREVAFSPRMIQFSLAPAYQASPQKSERHRRSLYRYRVRGLPDPLLEVLHQPDTQESCEMRLQSSGAPQALSLWNSDTMQQRALACAHRFTHSSASEEDPVVRTFLGILGRKPRKDEWKRCSDFLNDMVAYHASKTPTANPYPTYLSRSLVEEFSGLAFTYQEPLPAYQDFEYDLQSGDMPPATRALADLCLLLLNSNEFLFVY